MDDLRNALNPLSRTATLSHTPLATAPIRLFLSDREEAGADFTITGNVITLGARINIKGDLRLDYEADLRERGVVVAAPSPTTGRSDELSRALVLSSLMREEAAYENSRREERETRKDNAIQHYDVDRPSAAPTPRSLYLLQSYAEANQRRQVDAARADSKTSRELSLQGLDGLGDGVLTHVLNRARIKSPSTRRQSSQVDFAIEGSNNRASKHVISARSTWLIGDHLRDDASEGANK